MKDQILPFADAYSQQSCNNWWTDTSLKLSVEHGVKTVTYYKKTKVRSECVF